MYIDKEKNWKGKFKRKETSFEFNSINEYIFGHIGMGFDFNRKENPLRENNSDDAKIIDHQLVNQYPIWSAGADVDYLYDDWIYVTLDSGEKGYIRWKKGNKILIRIYFTC